MSRGSRLKTRQKRSCPDSRTACPRGPCNYCAGYQGGTQSPATAAATGGINDCAGGLGGPTHSPIVDVVSRLSDLYLVISGHTHKAYNCRLPNSAGRLIPVTQAGYYGRLLSNIDLSVDRSTGQVTHIAASNLLVSHPAADALTSPVHPFLLSPSNRGNSRASRRLRRRCRTTG